MLGTIATRLAREPAAVAQTIERGRAELEDAGLAVEYLEIRESETLAPITAEVTASARVFAAVQLGRTRLIDNLPVA